MPQSTICFAQGRLLTCSSIRARKLMTIEPAAGDNIHPIPSPGLAPQPAAPETGQIARTASIISLGNVASRVLGLVRESVKSDLFGAGATVDAYNIAVYVPVMLYDLIIGGM